MLPTILPTPMDIFWKATLEILPMVIQAIPPRIPSDISFLMSPSEFCHRISLKIPGIPLSNLKEIKNIYISGFPSDICPIFSLSILQSTLSGISQTVFYSKNLAGISLGVRIDCIDHK